MTTARTLLASALLACGWAAAPAHADLRTASRAAKDSQPKYSSPTRPELRDAQVRLDTDAGRVDVTVNLYDGLADPAVTSALRPWAIHVGLGDWVRPGSCEGARETWLRLDAALGDDLPGVLDRVIDGEGPDSEFPDTPVAKTFSADRSTVTLSVTTPALVGVNLICAEVEVADPEHGESSSTFAFVFAGYSVLDGGFQREATAQLDAQVNALDAFWFDERPESFAPPGSRCDRPVGETVTCRVTTRLRDVPGRPKLTLHGVLKLDAKRLMRSTPRDAMPWSYAMRGRVTWRRCPSLGGTTPRNLRGRSCHLNVRWNGRDELFQAVVRTRRVRG